MTIGQRIAQKRKELGLSQEALGEQLGVSRQSIYKWESDSTLPEIEKLIALSRLFAVPVGWLLGVEEKTEDSPQPEWNGELTDAQLKMVEEIVGRYLSAQPVPKKRRGWLYAAAVIILIVVFANLFSRLDQLDSRYSSLQNSVGNITYSVNSQIGGISSRVEEILKSQNALTAEYDSEIASMDLTANNVTFSAWAVPKTYEDGMTAEFIADSSGEIITVPALLQPGQKFSAEITCPLTDNITLSVVFILPGGTRQTQLLDTYYDLLLSSFPSAMLHDRAHLFGEDVVDGKITLTNTYVTLAPSYEGKGGAKIASIQIGLFRNGKLVAWAEPTEQPENYTGFDDEAFYRLPDLVLEYLTEEDVLCFAALVTDTFGRQFMACEVPYVLKTDTAFDTPYLTYPDSVQLSRDPSDWIFE